MDTKFENKLKEIIRSEVGFSSQSAMKARLMSNLHYKDSFWRSVRHVFAGVELSVRSRVLMKEKLLTIIEGQKNEFWDIFALRKGLAFVSAFMLVAVMVLQPFSVIPVVNAGSFTRVANYSGQVDVLRSNSILGITKEFNVLEGDVIQTSPAGFVEVIFPDNSIIRLGGSTRVVFRKLERFEEYETYHIAVLEGEVWGNMVGADPDTVFKFDAYNVLGKIITDATFDIEVNDSFMQLLAVDESIDLKITNDNEVVSTELHEGKLIRIKKETSYLSYLDSLAFNESLSEFDLDWVRGNINQDNIYETQLFEDLSKKRVKAAGITPDNPFYALKRLSRATRVALAIDPVKKNQLEIGYANQKLLEAEVLISEGKEKVADKLIQDFHQDVAKVKDEIDNIKKSNPDGATTIEATLASSLQGHKKDLKNVLPDNDTYKIKEAINDVELIVASSPGEKKKLEIRQAAATLVEAKELAEAGNDELAKEQLSLYVGKLDQATKDIENLPDDEVEVVVTSLIKTTQESKSIIDSTVIMNLENSELQEGVDIVAEVTKNTFTEATFRLDSFTLNPEVVQTVEQLKTETVSVDQLEGANLKVDDIDLN